MVDCETRLEAALTDVDSQIVRTGKLFATANIGRLNNDAKRASEAVVQAVKASGKHGPENSNQLIGLFAD